MTGAKHHAASPRLLFVTGVVVLALAGLAIASPGAATIRLGKTYYGGGAALRLQNGYGYAIYISTHDRRDKSRCFGRCTLRFKPVITDKRVTAWGGVRRGLLGVIKRSDDVEQVTYNHHPLYTATDDSSPSYAVDDSCRIDHGRWGRWYVIGRNGSPDKHFGCQGY